MNVNEIYNIVKMETKGMDAIYEDFIKYLVGVIGFDILKEENLIESCGVINGRQLYALCDRKDK